MDPLRDLMYPSSIAVWGASDNPLKMGTMQMANLLETGFPGKVYPIHPRLDTVLGCPAFPDIASVDRTVDLALLTLPTGVVPGVLEECGRAGIKRAIVISGGFKEAGAAGLAAEREIHAIARAHGIRFLGPNCVGVLNAAVPLNCTTIPDPPLGGGIAIASQSGAYTAMIYPLLRELGMKIRQTISVGNEADLDLVDCLGYLAGEPDIKAIGLYVETIRRPREFVRLAKQAALTKPVAAMYVGGTEAGSRSSRSHTGALSGPDGVYDGLFRQSGVIRADDMDEMLDILKLASLQKLDGPRLAVITNSGGPGSSLAYHIEKAGLRVPPFSDALAARLDEMTGPLAFVRNPIDLTFDTNLFLLRDLAATVMASGEVDGVVIYGLMGSEFTGNLEKHFPAIGAARDSWEASYRGLLAEFGELPARHGKLLAVMSFLPGSSTTVSTLTAAGIPVFSGARRLARALASICAA